jgi:hypothetical protein
MPIGFDIEALRQNLKCHVYFETGLWDPRDDVSCTKALECNFDRVYCIEIRDDWVELGKKIYSEAIQSGHLRLIKDDSANLSMHLDGNPDFEKKTMFFLDAHVDNDNIHNFKKRCPLFEELKAIQQLSRKDHVIMIDDMRIVTQTFPWGEDSYGNINFAQRIMDLIREINPNYKFELLDGCVPRDVLLAYV